MEHNIEGFIEMFQGFFYEINLIRFRLPHVIYR